MPCIVISQQVRLLVSFDKCMHRMRKRTHRTVVLSIVQETTPFHVNAGSRQQCLPGVPHKIRSSKEVPFFKKGDDGSFMYMSQCRYMQLYGCRIPALTCHCRSCSRTPMLLYLSGWPTCTCTTETAKRLGQVTALICWCLVFLLSHWEYQSMKTLPIWNS